MTTKTPGKTIRTTTTEDGTVYALRFHKGESGGMGLYLQYGDETAHVGDVADPDNFDYAVDVAEEEMRVLRAEAFAEFGY